MSTDIHDRVSDVPKENYAPRYSETVDISVGDHVFTNITTCLHVAVAGDIAVVEKGAPGVTAIYKNVQPGILIGRFEKIVSVGTTIIGANEIRGRW